MALAYVIYSGNNNTYISTNAYDIGSKTLIEKHASLELELKVWYNDYIWVTWGYAILSAYAFLLALWSYLNTRHNSKCSKDVRSGMFKK